MSYSLTQLPVTAHHHTHHHHSDPAATEAEYDRLRAIAHAKSDERRKLAERSQAAYRSGDKAGAHELSQSAKALAAEADRYHAQARDLILSANNANSPPGTIDLHGLYESEVERVLDGLVAGRWCVIVGRGNHSTGEPVLGKAVKRVCREKGWRWEKVEGNEGRLWVLVKGGEDGPHHGGHHRPPQHGGYPGQDGHGGHGKPPQEEEEEKGLLEKVLESFCGKGCVVM